MSVAGRCPAIAINLTGLDHLLPGLPEIVALAPAIEAAGADQITLSEHVAMGAEIVGYPYGTYPSTPDAAWFEPVATLSAIAAVTRRARLSTSILIGPLRPAALLAKQLATLDHLAGGRLEIGLGTGWQRAEYEACGVPFGRRLRRLDEQVRAMQALWNAAPASFAGESLRFDGLYSCPLPRQQGGIPIIFGLAATPANVARMVALGDGWSPWFGLPAGAPARGAHEAELAALAIGVAALHQGLLAAEREVSGFLIRVMPQPQADARGGFDLDRTLAIADDYGSAGATMLEFAPGLFAREADEILPIVRRLIEWRDRI